ncbi:hypothetical protein Hanom_Chr11g01014421 [Helianthus anomalus]
MCIFTLLPECNDVAIAEYEKEIDKDEDVVIAEEPYSSVYFEDEDSEILRPYLEQQTENEKTFEDPTKDYDPEVLEHAWDYTYWDEEDDWYHNPYEGEQGSDSDWSCLAYCHWKYGRKQYLDLLYDVFWTTKLGNLY